MIRAAIEIGGSALIFVAIGVGIWYGMYQLRHAKRNLDRDEAREERAFQAETKG